MTATKDDNSASTRDARPMTTASDDVRVQELLWRAEQAGSVVVSLDDMRKIANAPPDGTLSKPTADGGLPDLLPDLWASVTDSYVGDVSAVIAASYNDGWNDCREAYTNQCRNARVVDDAYETRCPGCGWQITAALNQEK